jgi:hypothetical protein
LELSDSEGEDLWYNDDEVTKEKDGTAYWWEKVDLGMPGDGAESEDKEPDDSFDGLRSMDGSDSDNVKKWYRQFNEKFDMKIPIEFQIGDHFRDMHVFKRALKTLAVQQGFDYVFKHNDTSRVNAIYKHSSRCDGRIYAFTDATRTCSQTKTYYPTHNCGAQYERRRCDVEYLVRTYKKDFKDDPT